MEEGERRGEEENEEEVKEEEQEQEEAEEQQQLEAPARISVKSEEKQHQEEIVQRRWQFEEEVDEVDERDPLDKSVKELLSYHKHEKVKQNVDFRVPPPVDKRSLSHSYRSISPRKIKDLLRPQSAPQSAHAASSSSSSSSSASLSFRERFLEELRQQQQDDDEEIEAETAAAAEIHRFSFEYDDHEDDADGDSSSNVKQESPYRLTRRKIPQFDRSKSHPRLSYSNPPWLTANLTQGSQGSDGSTISTNTVVANPSTKFMRLRRKKLQEDEKALYHQVFQEAKIMQVRFVTCVEEANLFQKSLGRETRYRIVERGQREDAQWSMLLRDDRRLGKEELIPAGTGVRLAKMLVEVTDPLRDVRYLGTDHFFREHGRLQNEFRKHQTLLPVRELHRPQTTSSTSATHIARPSTAGGTTGNRRSSLQTLPSSATGFTPQNDPTPATNTYDKVSKYAGSIAAGSGGMIPVAVAPRSKFTRKEIEAKLREVLHSIVAKSRLAKQQLEQIEALGWNIA